jgi:hypothetical protein
VGYGIDDPALHVKLGPKMLLEVAVSLLEAQGLLLITVGFTHHTGPWKEALVCVSAWAYGLCKVHYLNPEVDSGVKWLRASK